MGNNNIKKNYIYNLIYQIFKIIIPIISTPYLARTMGAEAIGIYGYTLSITTGFIILGSLGMATYAQREIAYVQDDITKRTKIFYEIIILKLITLGISTIIYWFAFAKQGEYSIYYKILVIELIANCIDISWFFQGMEEFKKIITRNVVIKVVTLILIFIFIKTPDDLWKYILIYVLSTFFANFILWIYLPKYIKKDSFKDINLKQHIKPIIILFIPQIATQIYSVLDKAMIGYLVPDIREVGYYEQAQKIINILLTVITSLGIVMLPRISKIYAEGKKENIQQYIEKSFNFLFFIGMPMIFGIIAVSDSFVPIFFGNGYEKVEILINIMSCIILFMGISNILGTQYLLPTKKQKEYTISVFAGAIINVITNFMLIRKYQSIGATIATVIAELIVAVVQLYFARNVISVKKIVKKAPKYMISATFMFAICIIIKPILQNGIVCLFIQVSIGVVIYLLNLFILRDEFFNNILNQIIIKLKNMINSNNNNKNKEENKCHKERE